jgi:AcrR family transcriptional regulator
MVPVGGREVAIRAATLALLAEVGYESMSMDAVAARARASKATIYRRWPGKREMVLDAVRSRTCAPTIAADTGSLRGDLVAALRAMAEQAQGEDVDLIAGVLHAMQCAPDLAACMRSQVFESKLAAIGLVLDRAVARGEVPPTAEATLAHELAGALWLHRVLVVGAPVDDAFIAHVVDDVLIPLLTRDIPSPTIRSTS